jgi:hypothetical protein
VSQANERLRPSTDSIGFSRSESPRIRSEIVLAKLTSQYPYQRQVAVGLIAPVNALRIARRAYPESGSDLSCSAVTNQHRETPPCYPSRPAAKFRQIIAACVEEHVGKRVECNSRNRTGISKCINIRKRRSFVACSQP